MPKKILIIDDELDMVKVVTIRFEASGYEVISASNGQEGIDKSKRFKVDLILLDIIMPNMDGYEVCRKLKTDPKTKNIPIVIFTAAGQQDLEKRCMALGPDAVIRKPFETAELLEIVNKALKRA